MFLFATLLISLGILSSCERVVVNSSDNDELIASVSDLEGGIGFQQVAPYIIAKCATCHTHQAWYGYNENDYAAAGLVSGTDYVNSKMYYRLSTSTEGPGPHNMPQGGGAAFTDAEVELMKNWIQTFGL